MLTIIKLFCISNERYSYEILLMELEEGTQTAILSAGSYIHTLTASSTGGSHTHSIPQHTHTATAANASITPSGTISSTGSGSSFSIMPPYLAVNVWQRVE